MYAEYLHTTYQDSMYHIYVAADTVIHKTDSFSHNMSKMTIRILYNMYIVCP